MATRVFISYASEDLALASEMRQWLADDGHEVFLDQHPRDGIVVGEDWERRLHERLRWADAVVCVVTSAYLTSTWCAAEVAIAQALGSRVLPLQAEPDLTHPLLKAVQHIDLARDPVGTHAALVNALRRVDAAGGLSWPDDRCPFPGLRPFEIDQHRVFFGRTDEIQQLVELLRSPAEQAKGAALLVVGPSGCGKSSLVRAGLLPMMAGESGWRALSPILPGTDPVAALARELAAAARRIKLGWSVADVHRQLDDYQRGRGLTGLVDELLLADPSGPQRRMLIVVDQFEELLTQTRPTERAHFVELLSLALTGPVQAVCTLRPEFLDELLNNPELAMLPTRTVTLRPLRRETLRAVIEKPARLAGIKVDAPLVDQLVDDTDSGEALPLLAFTLAQLADGISRGGRLSAARYDQLGGVQGALTRQADAALAEAVKVGGRSRHAVLAGLLRLVTVDEQGRPTRWRVPRDELPTPMVPELNTFVARRLLTIDTDNSTVVIGVTHEAFLSAWPPLAQAIAANASALHARRTVEHAATDWHQNGRPRERLWGGGQLAAAVTDTGARICAGRTSPGQQDRSRWPARRRRVLVTDRVDTSPAARDFLHASIRHDRYRRRRITTTLSVLLILAVAAAGVAGYQRGEARKQQRIAVASQLITRADAVRDTDPLTALLLGIAAQRIHPGGETEASLVNTLTTTRYVGTLKADSGSVDSVALSRSGRTLATGHSDGTVILWDLTDPALPQQLGTPLTGHNDAISSVAFAPDGRTLATASFDRTVALWDLPNPVRPRQFLTGHTSPVNSVTFAPDGRTLATASDDSTALLWNLTDAAGPQLPESALTSHTGRVTDVAFASGRLATASSDGTVILWDLTNREPQRLGQPLTGQSSPADSVTFAPDGHTVDITGSDGTVTRRDPTDPDRPFPEQPPRPSGLVDPLAVAPDGNLMVTASRDGEVILWYRTDRSQDWPLWKPLQTDHRSMVTATTFSTDGRTLATASSDGSVILWDLTDRARPRPLGNPLMTGHAGSVTAVALAPDGNTLATGGADATVILWGLTELNQVRGQAIQRACAITGSGFDRDDWDRYIPLPYQDTCSPITAGGDGSR
ncbi:MAG: TIR domain-containing protein [Pseudonocardiaceae bacterium]